MSSVRLLLLASDSEVLNDPTYGVHAIARHLFPVTGVLHTAHSRAYISIETVTKAIHCLVTLLQESQTLEGKFSQLLCLPLGSFHG